MAPKISSAEWDVMSVVWAKAPAPVSAAEVFEALPAGHGWKPKTVNTFLTRLVDKGALKVNRTEKAFLYTARVPRESCVQSESQSFLQRVFRGATGDLVKHFCAQADLTPDEIQELEQLLKAKRSRK